VFDEVWGDLEMALGERTRDPNPTAWPFGFVHRQDVGRAGRQAQAAANAGEHVVVLVPESGMSRPERWLGQKPM
jgi:hypothetical protein